MKSEPETQYIFSPKREVENKLKWGLLGLAAVLGIILFAFWETLMSLEAVKTIYAVTGEYTSVENLFRGFTFFGDDEGFIILIAAILWCVNKTFGFGTLLILVFSGIYIYLLKEITAIDRPDIAGVEPPESLSFPSGHTLGVLAMWSYLAINIKRRGFWIFTIILIIMVAFSRVFIGVHFPGDVIGGIALGIIFLFIYFLGGGLVSGSGIKISFPLQVILQLIIFSALFYVTTVVLSGSDPPKVMGFFAGFCLGYTVETEKVRFHPRGEFWKHVIKFIIGMAVLLGIQQGLKVVLPVMADPETGWFFMRYFLAGIWLTLLAPLVFVWTGLASRNGNVQHSDVSSFIDD